MGVAVHKSGHDNLAGGADVLHALQVAGGLFHLFPGADGFDAVIFNIEPAVFHHAHIVVALAAHGEHLGGVFDDQTALFLFVLFLCLHSVSPFMS